MLVVLGGDAHWDAHDDDDDAGTEIPSIP